MSSAAATDPTQAPNAGQSLALLWREAIPIQVLAFTQAPACQSPVWANLVRSGQEEKQQEKEERQ
jgi:hypothetical protein